MIVVLENVWAHKNNVFIICSLFLIFSSCWSKFQQDEKIFYCISRGNNQLEVIGYRMDYVKPISTERREVTTFISCSVYGDDEQKSYFSYFSRKKQLVVTKDSVFLGFQEKSPLMTTRTSAPIIFSDPEFPSYFQYIRDTVIFVAGDKYTAHYFLTKPFCFSEDTLFVEDKVSEYFCDQEFKLIYSECPISPISKVYDDDDDSVTDIIIYSRINEHQIPPKIVKELTRLSKRQRYSDSPLL